jgi:hypothetical protein
MQYSRRRKNDTRRPTNLCGSTTAAAGGGSGSLDNSASKTTKLHDRVLAGMIRVLGISDWLMMGRYPVPLMWSDTVT